MDVAHEALIRYWTLLREWIDKNRDKLRQKRKIETAAQEWENNGNKKDYLLAGKQLRDAKRFQKEQNLNLALSNLAVEFIQKNAKYRRNHSLRLIGFVFIPIVFSAIFLAFVGERQIRINQYWNIVEAAKGEKDSPARISALQELVKLDVRLNSIPLNGAHLSNTNLYDAYLVDANLSGANLSGANLNNAYLVGANLSRANLSRAYLSAVLSRANLNDANLNGARLVGANLIDTNFSGANLTGTIFWNKKYEAMNITPEQIKKAKNWEKAIYSPEFRKELGLPPE